MPWSPAECYKNIKAESFYLQFLKTYETNYSAMDEKIISERQPFKYLKVFNLFKGSVGLEHSLNASKNLMKVWKFPKSKHFLLPDTHMCVCVSGGKTCSFFRKIWRALFFVRPVLRFLKVAWLAKFDQPYHWFAKLVLCVKYFMKVLGGIRSEEKKSWIS